MPFFYGPHFSLFFPYFVDWKQALEGATQANPSKGSSRTRRVPRGRVWTRRRKLRAGGGSLFSFVAAIGSKHTELVVRFARRHTHYGSGSCCSEYNGGNCQHYCWQRSRRRQIGNPGRWRRDACAAVTLGQSRTIGVCLAGRFGGYARVSQVCFGSYRLILSRGMFLMLSWRDIENGTARRVATL